MKKIMKSIWLCLIFISVQAFSHPPSDIIINYDVKTKMLKALIMHDVLNPINHHIKKVDVSMNGKQIIEQFISVQDNNRNQTVMYFIPDAKIGDNIAVDAFCSISGDLTKQITIK